MRSGIKFGSFSDLPHEIIVNICSRLPAKSVGRARCVSKPWRTLLSTPEFIKSHLTHIKRHLSESVSLIVSSNDFTVLTLNNAHHQGDEITASAKKLIPTTNPRSWFDIFGSCDGLLLAGIHADFICNKIRKLFIINPTTRERMKVPLSPFTLHPDKHYGYTVYGLGYDSVTHDYKVVAISYYFRDSLDGIVPIYNTTYVHIYSVKNGTWKKCEGAPFNLALGDKDIPPGVLVENCLHWIARRLTDNSVVIAAFNVEDEKFYEFPAPTSIDPDEIKRHKFEVLAGCLCIFNTRIDVWMMKEYGVPESWVKLATFEPMGAQLGPLGLLGYENLVLVKINPPDLGFVTYDLKAKTFKDVVVEGMSSDDFYIWITFMETPVSPRRVI